MVLGHLNIKIQVEVEDVALHLFKHLLVWFTPNVYSGQDMCLLSFAILKPLDVLSGPVDLPFPHNLDISATFRKYQGLGGNLFFE